MPEAGFLEKKPISPTGVVLVVGMHAALITALAMSKMDMPAMPEFIPLPTTNIPIPPDPQPIPDPPKQTEEVRPKTQIDYVKPIVPPLPSPTPTVIPTPQPNVQYFDPRPAGDAKSDAKPAIDPPKPAPPAVRVDAEMLRSSELQPPYPASEERAGNEGRVSIRVTIGANGRVTAAEKVSATSDAFYRATERHALRAWRFKPATVDGKPVESRKVLTVHFRLQD
ncbi:MAG TPA: TonB family protein [Allosphingosinicella sp.]|uniref:energy transducer TonB n=1 Tax=Allosphingosinicella sp. TaxID=2823234 RepID=UPI002EDB798B